MACVVLSACGAARASGGGTLLDGSAGDLGQAEVAAVDGASDASDTPAVDVPAPDVPAPDAPFADLVLPDAPDANVEPPSPPMTYDFVVASMAIDEEPAGRAPTPSTQRQGVAGFNLDGRATGPRGTSSADCSHGDFFSTLDPDQNMGTCTEGVDRGGASCVGGVDNQLPEIAGIVSGFGTDLGAAYRDSLAQGRIVMLVRVADVNGSPGPTLDDASVTVTVYTRGRPLFARCAEREMPGQRYAIDAASPEASFSGAIVRGRLVVGAGPATARPALSVPFPFGDRSLLLPVSEPQLRVDLGVDRATAGNLGGLVPFGSLLPLFLAALPPGIPEGTIRVVLASLVDVSYPRDAAMGCVFPNGAIGFGYGFTLLRANVSPMRVSGPQPGMCGS